MKFSVACNWDPALLEHLSRESSSVDILFGQITDDPFGGGRGSFLVPKVSREQAKEFIVEARRRGFRFNYLLNGACQDNLETTRHGNRVLFDHIEWVVSTGADTVTVTLPILLVWIKRHFPHFKVVVSSWARVANVKRAKYWEDLGADQIILAESATRDFASLRSMRRALRCTLEVIANPSCLYFCYLDTNHINMMTHAAQGGHVSGGFVLDHCQVYCQRMKLGRPDELIKARWVRPEDVGDYEDVVDSLKLLERFRTTDTLMQVVRAYEQRRFDGNWVEMLTLPRRNAHNPPNLEYLIRPDCVNIDLMLEMADIFGYSFSDVMQIDNRALDGFAEHFKTHDCYHSSCEECGYCADWAKKVVRVDEEKRRGILKKFDTFIEAIVERRTFAENELPDVSHVRLSSEAASVLDSLMLLVPPPLAAFARAKIVAGAAQLAAQQAAEASGGNGAVGTQAVVCAFWMGTPEPSRDPVRQALEQMGLWHHIAAIAS